MLQMGAAKKKGIKWKRMEKAKGRMRKPDPRGRSHTLQR